MIDILARLADRIDSQAAISARPGQLEDLERIATQLRAERDRLHSWVGIIGLLDEHYPADVFAGRLDPGPRIIALTREVDRLRTELAAREQVVTWTAEVKGRLARAGVLAVLEHEGFCRWPGHRDCCAATVEDCTCNADLNVRTLERLGWLRVTE